MLYKKLAHTRLTIKHWLASTSGKCSIGENVFWCSLQCPPTALHKHFDLRSISDKQMYLLVAEVTISWCKQHARSSNEGNPVPRWFDQGFYFLGL